MDGLCLEQVSTLTACTLLCFLTHVEPGNDRQFGVLSTLLGKPDWATDALFATNSARVSNRQSLISQMSSILQTRTTSAWIEALTGKGLPFAPINNIEQTFSHPQSVARGVTVEVEHPRAGKIKLAAPAVVYDGKKMEVSRAPPVLGQHTLEVLREDLGLDDDKIAELHQRGAV